jgi:hypothetical protein
VDGFSSRGFNIAGSRDDIFGTIGTSWYHVDHI